MSFSDLIAKQYEQELSVIKKAPFAFALVSLLFSGLWVALFHLSMLAVIDMKNDLLETQTQEISLLKQGKTDGNEAAKKNTKEQSSPLTLVEGKTFVNEKVLLDGYSYVNCLFENVTFTYNGGKSEVFNSRAIFNRSIRLETTNMTVKQVIKIFQGMGAFRIESVTPNPS